MKKTGKFKTFILITAIVTVIVISTVSANNKVKDTIKKKEESDKKLLSDANSVYYYGSSGSSAINELFTSLVDLTGAAPANVKFGINTTNGKLFYVNNLGNWVLHSSSTVTNNALTATFTPAVLNNSETDEQLVTINGVLLANDNLLSIKTDLSSFNQVDIRMLVVADNTVRVLVENNSTNTVTLPPITISALKLN